MTTIANRLSIVADMLADEGFQPRIPAEPAAIQFAAMECRKVAAELGAVPAADAFPKLPTPSVKTRGGAFSDPVLRYFTADQMRAYALAATAALQAALKASEETKQTIADLAEANNRSKLQRIAELEARQVPGPSDKPGLLLLQEGREVWSASGPEQGLWESLAGFCRAQYMTTDQQQGMHAIEQAVLGRPMPWNGGA